MHLLFCEASSWTAQIHGVRRSLVSGTEAAFTRHGQRVARRPWIAIFISILFTGLTMIGFLNFEIKTKFTELCLPADSDAKLNSDWLNENFPSELRAHSLILTANNVLTPAVLKAMLEIHRLVEKTTSSDGSTWFDHCKKMSVVKDLDPLLAGSRRKKRDEDYYEYDDYSSFGEDYDGDFFGLSSNDPTLWSSISTYPQPYCRVLDSFPSQCMEFSILELFAVDGDYDDEAIDNLTQETIIETINSVNKSGIFFNKRNFTKQLGTIQYDEQGRITGAKATIIQYYTAMNTTEVKQNPVPELSNPTTKQTYDFEKALLAILLNTTSYTKDMDGSVNVAHSVDIEVDKSIRGGIPLLGIGFGIMVLYVLFMLGDFNVVEHRAWLTIPAVLCVVMGIISCVGLGSAFGLPFGSFHLILPLILLAIGIDDAFVLVSALDNLTDDMKKNQSLEEKFGIVMRNSGISITVTSLTNIVAFAAGGFTSIPILSSFCIYCSIGIIGIYFHTVTFFLATLVLKQSHVDNAMDGCLPCFRHKNWIPRGAKDPNRFSMAVLFKNYATILMKLPTKVIILLVTFSLVGLGAWATSEVNQNLDYTDILSDGNYVNKWFGLKEKYFTSALDQAAVFVEDLNEKTFIPLHNLLQAMENENEIVSDLNFWTKDFIEYVNYLESNQELFPSKNMTAHFFQEKLTQFLFSPTGSKYRQDFTFPPGENLTCGMPSPKVLLNTIKFTHSLMEDSSVYIPAMAKIKTLVRTANLTGHRFPLTETYWHWELENILAKEFPRNLSIGIIVIFFMVSFLLFDIKVSIMVLICLIFSLINTMGFGHFWGLTINLFTTCIIIVSTGLYVDYSVHIAHAYLVQVNGSRSEKAMAAVSSMGSAVFNGGISTFLVVSILSLSPNFTWRLFFKFYLMNVVFGLFHGLAFLPVLLSWMGPELQIGKDEDHANDEKTQEMRPKLPTTNDVDHTTDGKTQEMGPKLQTTNDEDHPTDGKTQELRLPKSEMGPELQTSSNENHIKG